MTTKTIFTALMAIFMGITVHPQKNPDPNLTETMVDYDIAVLNIISPLDPSGFPLLSWEDITASITNLGNLAVDSFTITLNFNDFSTQTLITIVEDYTNTILPGETLQYTFSQQIFVPVATSGSPQNYHLCVSADLQGDMVNTNNFSCAYLGNNFPSYLSPIPYGPVNGPSQNSATYFAYDHEWWKFTIDEPYSHLVVALCGSSFDTQLQVYNPDGTSYWHNDDQCGAQSEISLWFLEEGTYWVKIYGWGSSYGSFILNITGTPAFDKIITEPSCIGASDGSIDLTLFIPATLSWSTGDTSLSISNLQAGTYSLTLTNALGTSIDYQIELTDPEQIEVHGHVQHGNVSQVCDGTIDLNIVGGSAPYTVFWNSGDTTANPGSLCGGGYLVTVSDANSCTAVATFALIDTNLQYINLKKGWNIFSTYMVPASLQIDSFLDTIISQVLIAKNYEGLVYWPVYGVNLIGDMNPGYGYQIKVINDATLAIAGSVIQPDTFAIPLTAGWSLLGYPRRFEMLVDTALTSIVGNVAILKDWLGQIYWPQYGVNLIGCLEPGQGYQIKMFTPDTIIYPANETGTPVFYCGQLISDYDGNIYQTIEIGSQCWMKENLRTTHYADGTAVNNASSIGYSTISETDSYYYDYLFDTANSALYGRLYTWPAAVNDTIGSSLTPSGIQGICPAGWHLPSDNEWKILEGTADTQYGVNHIAWNYSEGRGHDAGHRLKSEYGWNWGGGGNNLFFFSAKPSGRKSHGNNFNNLGNGAYFWSSTTVSFSDAFSRNFSAADIAYRYGMHKGNGFSVRCLKD